ncbi:MAG: type II toxin-antitoxin system prevent-host-death family antitoxin [Chloroflexi bacterium]|nr:type II toxin-antitoxin system prevent-host-death family antitoxin [Chloroflexota bacterium]MCZ7578878.1 type II toxin-antitoxin system prevent-host-death family antitoxin [Dehalococcoidia bacterium]
MRRIGIRELRQNASRYIHLVKSGETIKVTERGIPVALLTPLPADRAKTPREQLIAEGKLIPGTQDWSTLLPLPAMPGTKSSAEILEELREERL